MSVLFNVSSKVPRVLQAGLPRVTSIASVHVTGKDDQTSAAAKSSINDSQIIQAWKQGYSKETEKAVNQQILIGLASCYRYIAMANHFHRPDISLKGVGFFFKVLSLRELDQTSKLMRYQQSRCGKFVLSDIPKPARCDWTSVHDAMQDALAMEIASDKALQNVHNISTEQRDVHTELFLGKCLREKIKNIKTLSDNGARLRLAGGGKGQVLFDRSLLAVAENLINLDVRDTATSNISTYRKIRQAKSNRAKEIQ